MIINVRLRPAAQGYRIAEVHCGPASGDTGYALMCEYLKDPGAFTALVGGEKPLLGRPLNDVLCVDEIAQSRRLPVRCRQPRA